MYVGSRNRERGLAALDQLRSETGRNVFELVIMDVADLRSVKSAAASLGRVDAVVMNAGGAGGRYPAARRSRLEARRVADRVSGKRGRCDEPT